MGLGQNKWIPVSEKLPEEDEEVLVTVYFKGIKTRYSTGYVDNIKPCYYVDIAKHIGEEWQSLSDEYKVSPNRHVVIAWQPLPEPYKESEEEQMQTFGFCVYHEIECDYKGLCIECPHNTKEDKEWFEEDERKERDTE